MATVFCSDCANLMLPSSDDNNRLKYVCRTCPHSEYADENRVYFNNVQGTGEQDNMDNLQPENLIADPTLPRARVRCINCGGTESVWFQTVASEAEKMSLTFICVSCHAAWTA